MQKLLFEPKNSLINQSYAAKEIDEPLNGDGFGVSWYNPILSDLPGTFRSITPAWNNQNLKSIAPLVKSHCLMAHVRAATVGALSESNCHPFSYKQFTMMHNGDAPQFGTIKRLISNQLNDEMYNWIQGQTDSEHLFALFVQELNLRVKTTEISADLMAEALESMISKVEHILRDEGIQESAYLNMVVTDGERMVGMRYASQLEDEPMSLYYSEGSRYECIDGLCHMIPANDESRAMMIVSEKLTEFGEDWRQVPRNHMVMFYKDFSVRLRAVDLT